MSQEQDTTIVSIGWVRAVIKAEAEYIDRIALMQYLDAADIPVTKTEKKLIEAMPTLTDVGENYKKKLDAVYSLIHGIYYKNKYGVDANCKLYGRKKKKC